MCAVGGLSSSSALSGLVRPNVASWSSTDCTWNAARLCTHRIVITCPPPAPGWPSGTMATSWAASTGGFSVPSDEAGEVAAVAVDEAGLLELEGANAGEARGNAACDVELDVFAGAVGPHPDVVLGRGRAAAVALDRLEPLQLVGGIVGSEAAPEVGTEADYDVRSPGGH